MSGLRPGILLLPQLTISKRIIAIAILVGLSFLAWTLAEGAANGRALAFSLIVGSLFGIVLQRSRFCFFCMTRDFMDRRDSRGLLGLVLALAIGTMGYYAVFGAILPVPSAGRLPPDAHIGPVSWVLAIAALVFGSGMAISGSCISAHLYRLGEGSIGSFFALLGTVLGFILGFFTWNGLYLQAIQGAPVVWLPNYLGYGPSLLLQLAVLAILATILMRYHKDENSDLQEQLAGKQQFWTQIFQQRWATYVGGLLIGFLATIAYFRVAPLGVTAELGSLARSLGAQFQWFPSRLEGLDSYTGCATVVKDSIVSINGVFVFGLIFAALAAALMANDFKPVLPKASDLWRNFSGGLLMGWGAMTALGCTVGTLLSGIMAGALSGWVFAVFCFLGLWLTWTLRKRLS